MVYMNACRQGFFLTFASPDSMLIPVDERVICKAEADLIHALNSGLPVELISFST